MPFDAFRPSLNCLSEFCPYAGVKYFAALTPGAAGTYAVRMRWDALFTDLESQMTEQDRLALEAEVSDRVRAELVGIGIVDRLRGSMDCRLTAYLLCGETVHGVLRHVGADAMVIDEGRHQVLVPYVSVARYSGLGRLAPGEKSQVKRRLGLAHALRGLARDRARLSVTVSAGASSIRLDGVIDRVGADYFDLALVTPGEVRRMAQVQQVSTVPFTAISLVRSSGGGGL